MTKRQAELMQRIKAGTFFIRGADVRVAQALQAQGLVELTDDGPLGHGNRDGERWSVRAVHAVELLQIELGAGIVEVMQLDDADMCSELGVTCRYARGTRRRVVVAGKRNSLERLASALESRSAGGWDQPPHYYASARAAAR